MLEANSDQQCIDTLLHIMISYLIACVRAMGRGCVWAREEVPAEAPIDPWHWSAKYDGCVWAAVIPCRYLGENRWPEIKQMDSCLKI